ncbi:translation initiation factor IF-2 [bacterium]|nr:translation initiation factor IF-2 [bacterium]
MINISKLKETCSQNKKILLDKLTPAAEIIEQYNAAENADIAEAVVEEDKIIPPELKSITEEDFKAVASQNSKPATVAATKPQKPSVASKFKDAPVAKTETSEEFETDTKKKGGVTDKKKQQPDDKRKLSKKTKIQKGYEKNMSSYEYDDISGEIMKVRARKSFIDKEKKRMAPPVNIVIDHAVMNTETISIKQLSEKIGKTSVDIIKKLFLELQIIKTINDVIDFDTAEIIASMFNITLELQLEQTSEEKLIAFHSEDSEEDNTNLVRRPPIVTIMGHVDHGKTSILDYIRKANVASGEAGGITQHIGAYTAIVPSSEGKKTVTFLDTPGHEAFTSMRARGANITDIAIIVVAADDGIMPQTIEAINHAKAAKVPIIVAMNKMDKPVVNPDRVLQQLADQGLVSEEWMGDVPTIRVSAKTGMGIDSLLETIITIAEVNEYKANPDRSAKGTIIEAKLDKGKGPVATVLVQNGTLHTGDFIVAGTAIGRIRAMFDDKGKAVSAALPSTPVSVLGLQDVPNAGDQIMVVKDEKLSKQVVEERKNREKIEKLKTKKVTLEDVFSRIEEGKAKDLNLIIKGDVQGSVEAVKQSLGSLSNNEVIVHIVHSGVGAINESDITLADTTDAIIIGFNIRPDNNAKILADKNGVDIKLYRVIYDAINDIKLAIKGMLAPTYKETYLGRAEVRQVYKISSVGTIAGCMVKDGKVTRNAKVRLLRDGVVIFETVISSLKRMKDDVKEVASGYDCGIGLDKYNDINENDVIEAYIVEEVTK